MAYVGPVTVNVDASDKAFIVRFNTTSNITFSNIIPIIFTNLSITILYISITGVEFILHQCVQDIS